MTEYASGTRGLKITLVSYSVLLILQLVAYSLTSILVLLAGTLHTLSDVLVSGFLLFAVFWSQKPADEFHMFGHGRAQNVAALVSATIFISFMSLEMFREAIPKLFHPETIGFQNIDLALIVTIIGMGVVALPLVEILRGEERGASTRAQLVGLLKDEISHVAVLVGIALTAQGHYWADPSASIIVATVIAFAAFYLFRENFHYLVGRAPSKQFLKKVKSTAKSVKSVLGVHDLRGEYVGPNMIQASLHIQVAKGTPIEDSDRIAHQVEKEVSENVNCNYCVIHVDPKDDFLKKGEIKNV